MLTYKLDPTLTPRQLSELTSALDKLATDVTLDQTTAQLTIDNFSLDNQRAIEDLVMPCLPVVNEAPDWARLAALKRKRGLQSA